MTDLHSIAEKNARVSARGDYIRWLRKRFGSLDLMGVKEGEDKVLLRNIYVPLRLDSVDRRDEEMGKPGQEEPETLSGRDARDVIAENPFVAISGRPGSGKTTLVQALIGELCGEGESEFRQKLKGEKGILPVPLILRDYQDELPRVQRFEELLDLWWQKAVEEARDKGFGLDAERLRQSVAQEGDGIPMLVLFDGIDEVGGVVARQSVVRLARQAGEAGCRCILTGRPSGYQEIDLEAVGAPSRARLEVGSMDETAALLDGEVSSSASTQRRKAKPAVFGHSYFGAGYFIGPGKSKRYVFVHVLPFVSEQINLFLRRFYVLQDEWKVERERGITEFQNALANPERAHLLTLARRPIFLTLMALVHVNDRRMPHGRADLYKRIIDLYLIRQTKQRRLNYTTKGQAMPHWDEREVRRALGYLAWVGQHRGARVTNAGERDNRQVVWSREELLTELQGVLEGRTRSDGGAEGLPAERFREIKPENAEELLDYYLHPAGLLVEPAEGRIQFAHLSFQEYLCAEYIHGRALSLGSRRFLDALRKLLLDFLELPGWDEVGMLFLTIHAAQGAQTQGIAHLEVMAELNISRIAEARLLVAALTGQELDFAEAERVRWLPLALGAALLQPQTMLAKSFTAVPAWKNLGVALVCELLGADDPWNKLMHWLFGNPPGGKTPDEWELSGLRGAAEKLWRTQRRDNTLDVGEIGDLTDFQAGALLWALEDLRSGLRVGTPSNPIDVPEVSNALESWIRGVSSLFTKRELVEEDFVPKITHAGMALSLLTPSKGMLWKEALTRVSLDAWLLGLEAFEGSNDEVTVNPFFMLALYPIDNLPNSTRIAMRLYQILILVDALGSRNLANSATEHRPLTKFSGGMSMSFVRPFSPNDMFSLHLKLSLSPIVRQVQMISRSKLIADEHPRSLLRMLLRLRNPPGGLDILPSSSDGRWICVDLPGISTRLLGRVSRLREEIEALPNRAYAVARNHYVNKNINIGEFIFKHGANFRSVLMLFYSRYAAFDWFEEQAEDPDLMRRRGLRPGQPLPPEFGLFDETGRPNPQCPRNGVVQLRKWLDHDEAVLAWNFPEGLSEADRADLLGQLEILRHQPWSPQAAVDALLADWPESEPFRENTLEAAERPLIAVCEEILRELGEDVPAV